jgi:hypothetical protein
VQVSSIKIRVESAYDISAWKLKYDEPLSNFAFNFNWRHYIEVAARRRHPGGAVQADPS